MADAINLGKVADAIPDDRVATFIVFAKTGTFSGEEIDACYAAQGKYRARVVLLSKDELEPYEIFEGHDEARRSYSVDRLQGLADFTVDRYPQLEPEGMKDLKEPKTP